MSEDQVRVNQDSPRAAGEGQWIDAKGTKRGELCVIDFYTEMALEGRGYQVRAGTITAGATGNVAVTDSESEMCADAPSGITIIVVEAMISIDVGVNHAIEVSGQSVATASTSGGAFVPLPLLIGGPASTSTARVAEIGATVVTAELGTTTLKHFDAVSEFLNTDGADPSLSINPVLWQPKVPPVLNGIRCFYIQVGAVTAGCDYFAHFDFIELPTTSVS